MHIMAFLTKLLILSGFTINLCPHIMLNFNCKIAYFQLLNINQLLSFCTFYFHVHLIDQLHTFC
jgi:hypothetical protein